MVKAGEILTRNGVWWWERLHWPVLLFPMLDPLQKAFSKKWLKELPSRGSHQCLTCVTAGVFYAHGYFSLLYSST